MNQLFLQLVQSVTGNVVTIVALELVAAALGFVVAWYYARSVYTPVIKGLEADNANLNAKVVKLKDEFATLSEKVNRLGEKAAELEKEVAEKDTELKNLSSESGHIGKYAISNTKGGGNHFNLKATNGQIILTSLMHSSMAECTDAIESVRVNCSDDNRYERKISSNNKHFFNLTSSTGQVIGKSEMYESAAGMENGIASVKKNGLSTIIVEE
jgi:uncharacterized protein YegP (UPF0339 family)